MEATLSPVLTSCSTNELEFGRCAGRGEGGEKTTEVGNSNVCPCIMRVDVCVFVFVFV